MQYQALDCPVVFNFAPTAVMLGFLSCLGTVILCTIIFGAIGWYALTPPVITTFFGGGPAGVFGNSTGWLAWGYFSLESLLDCYCHLDKR